MRDAAWPGAYAVCVSAMLLGLWLQPFPPSVDYPQHLALARGDQC